MKKVTSADSVVMINHYKNILTAEGIPCQIRNEHLNQIYGEMPFTEVWPELWVLKDIDYDRAKQLIDSTIIDESPECALALHEMRRGERRPVRGLLELRLAAPGRTKLCN